MKIRAYKNYGVLTHEKAPTYTVGGPNSTAAAYDEIEIEIPGEFTVSESLMGGLLIDTPSGGTYLLNDILREKGGEPVLTWFDGKYHAVKLDYQEVDYDD